MDIGKAIAAEIKKRTDIIQQVNNEFKNEFAIYGVDISAENKQPSSGVYETEISYKNVPLELQERFKARLEELRKLVGV